MRLVARLIAKSLTLERPTAVAADEARKRSHGPWRTRDDAKLRVEDAVAHRMRGLA